MIDIVSYSIGASSSGGLPTEQKVVDLSMSTGDQVIDPTSGHVMSSVTVTKPATMSSSNIKKDVNIGGVIGSLVEAKPEQSKTVDLSMSTGNQTINPDSGHLLSAVTVNKPATMLPENIKDGINIGGVLGTLSGGGGDPLDPVTVYNNTRPTGWLKMPTPNPNEMYLLFHIPDGVSGLLAFKVRCTGNYTVALGTVVNDVFVQQSSTSIASETTYEVELFANDYGDLTDGMKQVMIKVTGTDILSWLAQTNSKKPSPGYFVNWNIVEIICNLPSATELEFNRLSKLRYFSGIGTSLITSMSSMFESCKSLVTVLQLDTSSVTTMDHMFGACTSLVSIPLLNTALVTNMEYMFYDCHSLIKIPLLNTSSVTNMDNMFSSCTSLVSIPLLNTALVTSMKYMFYDCLSLISIPVLNTSAVTSMSNMFQSDGSLTLIPPLDTSSVTDMRSVFFRCYSLSSIDFNSTIIGWAGSNIELIDCSLGHTAIIELFNSLPTITSAKAITLTGNPGIIELTDTDKAIATGKGWTLTL